MLVFRVLRARNGDGGFISQLGEARSGVVGFNNSLPEASSGDGGFTVACISGCRGLIGFKVATRLRPVREKFVLQAQNGRKTLFSGVLGEFFRGGAVGRVVLCEFFAPTGTAPRSCWRRAPPLELRDRLDSGGL